MVCKAFCLGLALTSTMLREERSSISRFALFALTVGALFLSATRSVALNLLAGFLIIVPLANDDWQDLCLIHCFATILAVILVMFASFAGILTIHDFIPNGRLVFGYGFAHPNGLGGLLFSAAGSLTIARWRKHAPVVPLVFSGCCAVFSYVALSSNASSVLCGAIFVINVLGLASSRVRNVTVTRQVARTALLVVPAALLAIMLVSAAHYDGSNGLFASLNRMTHARPFYSHEYYKAVGGFTITGAPVVVRGARHAGTAFWGLDSGYGHLALIYGLLATCMLGTTYAIATLKASKRGIDVATFTIVLLCALYLVVEPLPLSLHLSFLTLFLAYAFSSENSKPSQSSEESPAKASLMV
ncbi:hypothetical protein [Olsenella intestinalis]|uniref:hypothetical protein n=1 Tax=Olsenella intestinalis TaxID=2930083 RepID=UPI002010C467|nr:hypothetical protein [Olsenella intestinalis]